MFQIDPDEFISLENVSGFKNFNAQVPDDYFSKVSRKGDGFRDSFTKGCLYLAAHAERGENDCIVIASQYGNNQALSEFERSCSSEDGTVSAIHFSLATTSASATSTNIAYKIGGGNYTLNSGKNNFESAVMLAGLYLDDNKDSAVHVIWDDGSASQLGSMYYLKLKADERSTLTIIQDRNNAKLHCENDPDAIVCSDYEDFFLAAKKHQAGIPVLLANQADEIVIKFSRM